MRRSKNKLNKTVYGRDQYRGRSGPEYSDPGDGFAENSGYTGSGYKLRKYRGQFLDNLSIKEIQDQEAAEREADRQSETQEFLSRMGFIRDGSTLQ